MAKLLLAKLSLLAVCSAAMASAAPIVSVGTLFINDIGTGYADSQDDVLAFRLANFTGPFGGILTPVTFRNVTLAVTWQNPGSTIGNPLDWYTDANHLNPINSRDLAPGNVAYESTYFRRGWGIAQATLRIDFDPGLWNLVGGGTMAAPEFIEFLFTPVNLPANRSFLAASSLPAWELFVQSSDPVIPEPSTYMLGGLGLVGIVAQRLRRRSESSR